MAKRYLKNENGIVRAISTDNLQLEKPMLNENYDIDVHNRNMDKIDKAIQDVKGQVNGIELTAERVSIADTENLFEATNVEKALQEVITTVNNNKSQANGSIKTIKDSIGQLSELKTTAKNNLVSSINELFQNVSDGKSSIATAITDKGIDASANDSFSILADKIKKLSVSKIATGSFPKTGTPIYYQGAGNDDNKYYTAHITNLDFKPDFIVITVMENSPFEQSHTVYIEQDPNNYIVQIINIGTAERIQYKMFDKIEGEKVQNKGYIYDGGFHLPCYCDTNVYKTFYWTAIKYK